MKKKGNSAIGKRGGAPAREQSCSGIRAGAQGKKREKETSGAREGKVRGGRVWGGGEKPRKKLSKEMAKSQKADLGRHLQIRKAPSCGEGKFCQRIFRIDSTGKKKNGVQTLIWRRRVATCLVEKNGLKRRGKKTTNHRRGGNGKSPLFLGEHHFTIGKERRKKRRVWGGHSERIVSKTVPLFVGTNRKSSGRLSRSPLLKEGENCREQSWGKKVGAIPPGQWGKLEAPGRGGKKGEREKQHQRDWGKRGGGGMDPPFIHDRLRERALASNGEKGKKRKGRKFANKGEGGLVYSVPKGRPRVSAMEKGKEKEGGDNGQRTRGEERGKGTGRVFASRKKVLLVSKGRETPFVKATPEKLLGGVILWEEKRGTQSLNDPIDLGKGSRRGKGRGRGEGEFPGCERGGMYFLLSLEERRPLRRREGRTSPSTLRKRDTLTASRWGFVCC